MRRKYMIRRAVFLLLCLLVLFLIIFGITRLVRGKSSGGSTQNGPVYAAASYEANPSGPSAEMLLTPQGQTTLQEGASIRYTTDLSTINFARPGVYTLQTMYTAPDGTQKLYSTRLTVQDTTPPVGYGVDITITLGETREISDFIRDVSDVTDVAVTWIRKPDFTRVGVQTVELLLEDTSGNQTRLTATFTVTEG